jgi:hypothetical protein
MPLERESQAMISSVAGDGARPIACKPLAHDARGRSWVMLPVAVSTPGVVLLGALYFVLLVTLGIIAIRKGHWIMFIVGIFIPLFWIIGALLPPTRGTDPIG